MLRIFEAARAQHGEGAVDALYTAWGLRFFDGHTPHDDTLLTVCLTACHLDAELSAAADDEKWDGPIVDAMEVAYAFGGPKTQTPTIVVDGDPAVRLQGPRHGPGTHRRRRRPALGCDRRGRPAARVLRDHPTSR